jgi:hypothetical protein
MYTDYPLCPSQSAQRIDVHEELEFMVIDGFGVADALGLKLRATEPGVHALGPVPARGGVLRNTGSR